MNNNKIKIINNHNVKINNYIILKHLLLQIEILY